MATLAYFLGFLVAAIAVAEAGSNNITAILEGFPEYSLYNQYLTETRVADEINTRQSLTVLVLPNNAMSALIASANNSLPAIKKALLLLTLLDYFDLPKIQSLSQGTTISTTLFQTTGNAAGNTGGIVNITVLPHGRVAFGPAAPGSQLDANYTKSIKQLPYNFSVIEISAPILYPGLLDTPTAVNLTAALEKAGCGTFAGLLVSSGEIKRYQHDMAKGLTVLSPRDEAFKAHGVPDLNSLSAKQLHSVILYHAIPYYTPKASLKASGGAAMRTLASASNGRNFVLSATSRGDEVSLVTGVDSSRVANTILDVAPFCMLTVDNLLLPVELFGKGPSQSPAPAPAPAPAKSS